MPLDNLTELKRRVPGGKYNLARAVAERARQLQSGEKSPLVEVKTPNPLSVAIDEIVQGKISFTTTVYSEPAAPAEDVAAEDSLDETLLAIGDEAADAQTPNAGLENEIESVLGDDIK
jgi:DNA-directed RNA polymerase omega subunit